MVDVRSNASIIQIDSGGHIRFVLMYFERVVCIGTINEQDKWAGSIVGEGLFYNQVKQCFGSHQTFFLL